MQAMTLTTLAAAAFLKSLLRIAARNFERGDETEEDSGGERKQQSKQEDVGVGGDLFGAWKSGGESVEDRLRAESGEEQACNSANGSDENAFDQKLADDAGRSGAESGPDGEFVRADGGTGEEKIGNVDASDEKNEGNGAEESEEGGLDGAEVPFTERSESGADIFVGIRIGSGEILRDAQHIGTSLIDGNARFEAADGADAETSRARHEDGVVPLTDRNVDVGVAEDAEKVEGGRDDADDAVRLAVESESFAENGRIGGEFAFPKTSGEKNGGSGTDFFLFLGEGATHLGSDAELFEKAGGKHDGVELFSIAETGEDERAPTTHGCHGGEGAIGFLPIEKIGESDRAGGEIGFAFAEGDKLLGVRIWKRTEENGVDDGKEGRVGTEAESENGDGGGGETGIVAKHARGVTEILGEGFKKWEGTLIADAFFGLLEAAELKEGVAARFVMGEACADVVVDVELEVRGKFGVQFPFELQAAKEIADAKEQGVKSFHE